MGLLREILEDYTMAQVTLQTQLPAKPCNHTVPRGLLLVLQKKSCGASLWHFIP